MLRRKESGIGEHKIFTPYFVINTPRNVYLGNVYPTSPVAETPQNSDISLAQARLASQRTCLNIYYTSAMVMLLGHHIPN